MLKCYECKTHLRPAKTILIADDDLDDLQILEDVFTDLGGAVNLVLVRSGQAILDYLYSEKPGPCLVVLDYNMPGMSGAEVLRQVNGRERFGGIPFVVLSTSIAPHNIEECLSLGAAAYRVKPLTYSGYSAIVKEMLQLCNLTAIIK
jgi:CheY-like chemotaxis protein